MPVAYNPSTPTWTVLIYANGNTDMEPEISRGVQALSPETIPDGIKVVIQWSKAPQALVKIFRSQIEYPPTEQWTGVRRYTLDRTGLTPVADLGPVNMAAPQTLADFLVWGISQYPSDYIMVILSGHGAGFTGILTDYTQPYPMIMTIPGLTGTFQHSRQITGKPCDLLVIDACFMNMVEIWYELALAPSRPVKFLLLPQGDASLECLPYQILISALQPGLRQQLKLRQLLTNIVLQVNSADKISGDIFAVDLKPTYFTQLKYIVDQLAGLIINSNLDLAAILGKKYRQSQYYPLINLLKLTKILAAACPAVKHLQDILLTGLANILPTLAPAAESCPANHDATIFLPATPNLYSHYAAAYEQLAFIAANRWLQLLQGNAITDPATISHPTTPAGTLSSPVPLPINSVAYCCQTQNPHLTDEQVWQLLQELNWCK